MRIVFSLPKRRDNYEMIENNYCISRYRSDVIREKINLNFVLHTRYIFFIARFIFYRI